MIIPCKIKNFYKRWNIVYDEDKRFTDFKNRILSTIDDKLGELFLSDKNLERRFLKLTGKHFSEAKMQTGLGAINKAPLILPLS